MLNLLPSAGVPIRFYTQSLSILVIALKAQKRDTCANWLGLNWQAGLPKWFDELRQAFVPFYLILIGL